MLAIHPLLQKEKRKKEKKKRLIVSWVVKGEPRLLLSTGEAMPGVLYAILGCPIRETWTY